MIKTSAFAKVAVRKLSYPSVPLVSHNAKLTCRPKILPRSVSSGLRILDHVRSHETLITYPQVITYSSKTTGIYLGGEFPNLNFDSSSVLRADASPTTTHLVAYQQTLLTSADEKGRHTCSMGESLPHPQAGQWKTQSTP